MNTLNIDEHKSLMSNFWNEKLTKRLCNNNQTERTSKEKSNKKDHKHITQGESNCKLLKWKRQTAKSLRDKGLEMKGISCGGMESSISGKQETSLMNWSKKRVDAKLKIGETVPNKPFKRKLHGSIDTKGKKCKARQVKENTKIAASNSIRMNLKGNLRKMKSISPPNNWSLSRFNKMKNNLFKKKKIEENKRSNKKQKSSQIMTKTFSSNKKSENGSSQEQLYVEGYMKGKSQTKNTHKDSKKKSMHNEEPRGDFKKKSKISEEVGSNLKFKKYQVQRKGSDYENGNIFFKKTLPEILEGEHNESSEHTVIISGKKSSQKFRDFKRSEQSENLDLKESRNEYTYHGSGFTFILLYLLQTC